MMGIFQNILDLISTYCAEEISECLIKDKSCHFTFSTKNEPDANVQ